MRWWTKAWFNNRDKSEPSVEIPPERAAEFLSGQAAKDEWLEEHYPRQMEACRAAVQQTKEQLIKQLTPAQ